MLRKILIIDDNKDIVDVVTNRLERNNYQVISADNGTTGIDRARQENPDLIIMDIMMPEMLGDDAVRFLRADDSTKHIPVIFFTSLAEAPHGTEDNRVNVDGEFFMVIAKPFDSSRLLAQIKELIGN